ncbi:Gfo/Idh/MocA family oxidoreductase, partial [Streptomyces sp. Wh19]|uniref:Gfo/Idh/MocA family oxidoreductase n=1 Tax=Streptomyces sp. Wh19 TaxID=3076629 RepID=UPI0029583877
MRIGLIGTGRIGSFHAGVLARHPEVDDLVVTDTDGARAAEVAGRVGAKAVPGAADVLGAGVDAVVIASATSAHAELIG